MQNIIEKFLSLFKRPMGVTPRSNVSPDPPSSIGFKTGTTSTLALNTKAMEVFSYKGEFSIPIFDARFANDIHVNSESSSKIIYNVNLSNLTCTCKSYEHLKTIYGNRHPGILCKHLCKSLISNAQQLALKACEISCIELTMDKKVQETYYLLSHNAGEFIVAFTKDRGWVNICKEVYWGYSPSEQRWAGSIKPADAGMFQALAKYLLQRTTLPSTFNIEAESVRPSTTEIPRPKRQRWIKSTVAVSGGVKINFESDTCLTFLNCTLPLISSFENEVLLNPNLSLDIALATFLFKHEIRIKEIEEYYDRYRSKYQERLSQGQYSSEAIKFLNIRPFKCSNREMTILNGYDKDSLINTFTFKDSISIDKVKLVELLGGNEQFKFNLAFYIARGANSVHRSDHSDHYRSRFLSLVKTGLVKHGEAIEIGDLLKTLVIKDIRAVLSPVGLKCGTKEQGIEHILCLQNYRELVKPYLSKVDDYFKLMPLPFEIEGNLRTIVEKDLEYYNSIATITVNLTDNIQLV